MLKTPPPPAFHLSLPYAPARSSWFFDLSPGGCDLVVQINSASSVGAAEIKAEANAIQQVGAVEDCWV